MRRVALLVAEERLRDLHDRLRLAAEVEHLREPVAVEERDGVDARAQVPDGLLVPAEGEVDPLELPDLREAVEIVLEPRERGDGLRELVRRDTRQDVIAREQDVVHLQAHQPRAVPRDVVHAVAGADGVPVAQRAVDLLRAEGALGRLVHLEQRRALGVRHAGAAPEDVAVLRGDDDALGEAGEHARVELVDREAARASLP